MPRRTKAIIVATLVVILLAGGAYVGVQCSVQNPLTVRMLGYKRLTDHQVSVMFEMENTSAFPVTAVAYLGLYHPDPAGFDGYGYVIGEQWNGKTLRRGEKQVFDLPVLLESSHMGDSLYFLYVWDPTPIHLLRKIYPPYRKHQLPSSVPMRVGVDGPYTLEKATETQP